MRFISLKVVGYKRFLLNNIKSFTYKPTQLIQLILGTNGCGKSSLIEELSVLPADASDYSKEGSKVIEVINHGNTYILSSIFSPSTKHSFEKNGEELNPGGTATAQRELARQEFSITPMIHNLLIGKEKFTAMSPSRRREWFTLLTPINYDYALEVYAKLKERARDTSGALKLAKKRYVLESSKIITYAEEVKLRSGVEEMHTELKTLIAHSAPIERPLVEYENDQRANLEELGQLSNRLLRMRFVAPYGTHPRQVPIRDDWSVISKPGFTCVEDIDILLNEIRHNITAKEALINKAVSEHTKLNDTVKVLLRTGEAGINALMEKYQTVNVQKQTTLGKRILSIDHVDVFNALPALDSVHESLSAVFSAIPENGDKRFGQNALNDLQTKQLGLKDERLRLVGGVTKSATRLTHMEAHKTNGNTTCPQCSHQWVIGYNAIEFETLSKQVTELEAMIATIDIKLNIITEDITTNEEYIVLYKDFMRCVKFWPVLNSFWEYLINNEFITKSPRKALSILGSFKHDLNIELEAKKLNDELLEIKELIAAAEQIGDATLTEKNEELTTCTLAIDEMTAELALFKINLLEYYNYRKQLAEALVINGKISALMIHSENTNKIHIEMLRRETINHCIRQLQHSLALKQETLNAALLQKGIAADLEEQISILTIEDESSKMLVKQLSPTDGLIAEGLFGFIRNFTGQMNSLVRKIWTYPLQVMECGSSNTSSAELDYKFPMMVQSKSNVVSDISLGSEGQKEIIDLAFKIVAMRYLELSDSPLYLDEFGKSLDESHRVAASAAVKSLMETQPFTQLFMVSHYAAGYGSFTNSEVCVIDAKNITVPKIYNTHVTIQ